MIFFMNSGGEIVKTVPEQVNQGSANANSVYLVAPVPAGMAVTVAFRLPNGIILDPVVMTRMGEISGLTDVKGNGYNAWSYTLPNNVTEFYGTLTLQFYIYGANSVLASSSAAMEIARGVASLPETPSETVYDQILQTIAQIQNDLQSAYFAARALYPWQDTYAYGNNELVFYPNRGTYGVILKSLAEHNVMPPYNNDGTLNASNWEETTDFNVLQGLYTLEGDVTEAVSAAQASAQAAQSAQEAAGASASASAQSAQAAAASAQAVESAAEYLESVQSGAVSVPKATSDETGANIANRFSSVESDVQGLRDDFTNESHFRGYLATNAEVQALSGTPNDYAYSAESGTVWIYQTNTGWTNSGKAVPDQVIPKGTATPLMNGTAAVGNSDTYADALHVHPTDTTRASTAVATQSSNGLMSAADKTKLDGLGGDTVDANGTYPNMTVGNATNAVNATNASAAAIATVAEKMSSGAGSATNPIYINADGVPTAGTYTLGAACAKGVTDSTSANAIGTGSNLVTERDVYYGLPTINGSKSYNSDSVFYAPAAAGTLGQILKSLGSGTPSWSSGTVATPGTISSSGIEIGSSYKNYLRLVTVWMLENAQYGTLTLKAGGTTVAYAEGEHGYWGASTLCISALIPAGTACYCSFSNNNGTVKYVVTYI